MKYGKGKVLICEIMGFVRIFWKEQHPRGLNLPKTGISGQMGHLHEGICTKASFYY